MVPAPGIHHVCTSCPPPHSNGCVGGFLTTRGKERARLGSWTAQLLSVRRREMAAALFGSDPEMAGKENSPEVEIRAAELVTQLWNKKRSKARVCRDPRAIRRGPPGSSGSGRRRIGKAGTRRSGWNHLRVSYLNAHRRVSTVEEASNSKLDRMTQQIRVNHSRAGMMNHELALRTQ